MGAFNLGYPVYDLDVYSSDSGQQVIAAVSPRGALVTQIAVTDAATGAVLPPSRWRVQQTIATPTAWGLSTGCNRIRVRAGHAFVSCFNIAGQPHGIVVVVDLAARAVLRQFPFVDEQPTGMLVIGKALFVAGGRDVMVFNITDPARTTVVATCGAPCQRALVGPGQNAHSMGCVLAPHSTPRPPFPCRC